MVLLEVDQDAVSSDVRYEGAAENLFPHIYGALNLEAIVRVSDLTAVNGKFQFPSNYTFTAGTLIRSGRPGDEPGIVSCHAKAWEQSYRGILPDHILDALPSSSDRRMLMWKALLASNSQRTVFVAESARDGIVGFCVVGPARDEFMLGRGEMEALYLFSDYKGKGIGAALFRAGCQNLREKNFQKVYLWVVENNPTIDFYRNMGGSQILQTKTENIGEPIPHIGFEWKL
jgi:GNAT superfamily N-acetyltransferase